MARRRMIERAVKEKSPWDWLIADDERSRRERQAYALACQLDEEGRYSEADQALRSGGIPADTIQDRRRHLEWRLREGYSVTGDTLTRVRPVGETSVGDSQ